MRSTERVIGAPTPREEHDRQLCDFLPKGGHVRIERCRAAGESYHSVFPTLYRVQRLSDPVEAPLKQSSRLRPTTPARPP